MKLLRSLLGRRQFLFAAFMTSTVGLLSKKVANALNPVTATGTTLLPGISASVAKAAEKPRNVGMEGVFSDRYSHLLSPLKIRNTVLKNRMMHTRSHPHFMQGPETFPTEAAISHYACVARTAAIVTFRGETLPLRERKDLHGDIAHMPIWDIYDTGVQNYLAMVADAIHFYDSKVILGLKLPISDGYTISNAPMPGRMGQSSSGKEIPVEQLEKMIDNAVNQCLHFQSLGFDGVNIYMAYRAHILAHALSPALNKRTDKYGGSLENRARLPLELFQAIKKACGQDFLIEAQISGEEIAGGYTVKDLIQYVKLWEGLLDIIQVRSTDSTVAHPMGWNSEKGKPVTIHYAEAIKRSGAKIVTAPVGGYQDLDLNEEFIASGKTDMIAMARAYICDPEYGKKAYEGRGEDVIPCIRCNKCHGDTSWLDWCSVNPKFGIAYRVNRLVEPPRAPQKVAVIGGGPAGMRAAIIAAERGHKVTLYEKNNLLGGLLRHTDFAAFQWPIKDFKDYLIRQVNKTGVEVLLNRSATPEMIKAKGYDVALVALGSEPIIPKIPGSDSSNVWNVVNVFGNEKALGKNVVVIGGGHGSETALHLAQCGHKVTVLASGKELAPRGGPHQGISFESMNMFDFVLEATATRISNGKVFYKDAKGEEKSIQADSVVIYGGLKPRQDEALKFSGSAKRFFIIGDCSGRAGNLQKCNRIAFAAASQI